MASDFKVDIKINFQDMPDLIQDAMIKALTEAGMIVQASAVRNITRNGNVDTGRLRDSIDYDLALKDEQIICVVGTNVGYAPWIEYGEKSMAKFDSSSGRSSHGHVGRPPAPFLRPAFDENVKKIQNMMAKTLKEAVDKRK